MSEGNLTIAEKAALWEKQKLANAKEECEFRKKEADLEFKIKKILIPLGFTNISVHWYGGDRDYVNLDSYTHERISDAELAAVQKKLRKFPFSYRYGGVLVKRKRAFWDEFKEEE